MSTTRETNYEEDIEDEEQYSQSGKGTASFGESSSSLEKEEVTGSRGSMALLGDASFCGAADIFKNDNITKNNNNNNNEDELKFTEEPYSSRLLQEDFCKNETNISAESNNVQGLFGHQKTKRVLFFKQEEKEDGCCLGEKRQLVVVKKKST